MAYVCGLLTDLEKKLKKDQKKFDSFQKKSIMHFRCHERQRRKSKPSVLKSSLKISTDNLCGPSKRGLTKKRSNEGYQYG